MTVEALIIRGKLLCKQSIVKTYCTPGTRMWLQYQHTKPVEIQKNLQNPPLQKLVLLVLLNIHMYIRRISIILQKQSEMNPSGKANMRLRSNSVK